MNLKKTSIGIHLNYTLVAVSLLFFLGNIIACSATNTPIQSTQDSIPSINKTYQGFRLQITNLKLESRKKNQRKISCTLINTGREKIRLPSKSANAPTIIFQYDNSLNTSELEKEVRSLERALLKKKFTLDAGKIASNFELKFNVSQEEVAKKTKTKTKKSKSKDSKVVSTNNGITPIYDKDNCADLQIDTFFVLKRSKKWVELGFKITNHGNGPAGMYGETKETEDNVAVRAYVSGTPKLSRGDMILGGSFIEGGLEDKNGVLMPNESFSGSFRVETRKKTRYMPYFILSVDDYQSLWECNERNNVKALLDR